MDKKNVHFMGVGGSGCSAAFALARHSGFEVSGCDLEKTSPYLDKKLTKLVQTGHSSSHLVGVDLLVYSPAIPLLDQANKELTSAQEKGIRTMPWEKFLAEYIIPGKFLIAVSGAHGKGTTTAMIAAILEKANFDPTCLVGAKVSSWGRNYRLGGSKYFVLEADEYKERFLVYRPDFAVITNIDYDHPDYFKNIESVKSAFSKFVNNLKPGSVLVNGPDVDLKNPNGQTKKLEVVENFDLKLPGNYNKLNASLAAIVARSLNIKEKIIKETLESFPGLARRFEFKGEEKGVLVFDDYAVHPKEISETLKATREKFPDRIIWLVFQPHTFSRLKVFFGDFVSVFEDSPVDKILLVDIFAARERNEGTISSSDLVKKIKKKEVRYISSLDETAAYIAKYTSVGNVIMTMGAGDIYKLPDMILKKLSNKS